MSDRSRDRRFSDRPVRPIQQADWNRLKLGNILRNFSGKRILVIGDVGVDRYIIGSVERISPEAPVPIVTVKEEKLKLGLAANVADNIQALTGVPWLTGIIGSDRAGEDFRDLLRESRISCSHLITDKNRRTVLKERVVSERQQLLRVDYEHSHAINPEVERKLLDKIRKLISRCDAVILEDYAKGLLSRSSAQAIFSMAKKAGKIIAVDPNSKTPAELYLGASVLTPNTKEAERLAGFEIKDEVSLIAAGREILQKTRAAHVVITRGKDGMAIFSGRVRSASLIPTYAREVYDVSGAGDTVIAVMSLALASGATIEEASILGNLAAGVEVAKRGTATVSPDEIRMAMEFFGAVSVRS